MDTLPALSLIDRVVFLRRVPLFADLSPTDLKQIATITAERVYADGEELCRQGEPGDELYIITTGEVRVVVAIDEGCVLELTRCSSGEYVGEMAILSHEPRMASVIADGNVRVLSIDQQQFEGILRERPETSLAVIQVLCARLRATPSSASSATLPQTNPPSGTSRPPLEQTRLLGLRASACTIRVCSDIIRVPNVIRRWPW